MAAFQELGIVPSFFPMHTDCWGDWHRASVLGAERGNNMSPTGWALERGSGEVVGPQHRVPPIVGLKATTLWAVDQHVEGTSKGSIEPGKVADFLVLSENPIRIDPLRIADIQVLEPIKGGCSVYHRNAKTASNTVGFASSCAASAKCCTTMAPVGASLIGQELHHH